MFLQTYRCKPGFTTILFFSLTLFVIPSPPAAIAQDTASDFSPVDPLESHGEILGTVYLDKSDLPATEVVVTIRSLLSGISRSVLSDFSGRFHVRGLPTDTYQIVAEAQGYSSAQIITRVTGTHSGISLYLKSARSSFLPPTGYSISVRELQIPAKAREEYRRGITSLVKQDPAESLAHLNKAAALFPAYYEAYYHMGVAEIRLNHGDEALQNFQKAIDLSGGHYALAQFAYGLLLCNRGEPQEAERIIRYGLETDSNSAEGHFFLAIALVVLNRVDEAEKSVREALLRKPGLADAYLLLADIHAKRNDHTSQIHDLDTFLKLAPDAPQAEKARQIRDVVQRLVTQTNPEVASGRNPAAN